MFFLLSVSEGYKQKTPPVVSRAGFSLLKGEVLFRFIGRHWSVRRVGFRRLRRMALAQPGFVVVPPAMTARNHRPIGGQANHHIGVGCQAVTGHWVSPFRLRVLHRRSIGIDKVVPVWAAVQDNEANPIFGRFQVYHEKGVDLIRSLYPSGGASARTVNGNRGRYALGDFERYAKQKPQTL